MFAPPKKLVNLCIKTNVPCIKGEHREEKLWPRQAGRRYLLTILCPELIHESQDLTQDRVDYGGYQDPQWMPEEVKHVVQQGKESKNEQRMGSQP